MVPTQLCLEPVKADLVVRGMCISLDAFFVLLYMLRDKYVRETTNQSSLASKTSVVWIRQPQPA